MNTNPITALLGPVTDREYLEHIGVIEPLPLGPMPVLEFDGEGCDMTPQQVKEQFRREGKTFKDFATENNFPYGEVIRVVNGINKARRGRGHEIAVRLGLKAAA